jgi:hypothetical protein
MTDKLTIMKETFAAQITQKLILGMNKIETTKDINQSKLKEMYIQLCGEIYIDITNATNAITIESDNIMRRKYSICNT